MTRSDWNLLALSCAAGDTLTPAQLQKSLFLLQESFPGLYASPYDFQPYDFGPFDARVYQDAELLASRGLAMVGGSQGGWKTFCATQPGIASAKSLEPLANAEAFAYLRKVVAWARSLSFQDLVRSIYKAYPDMKANSFSGMTNDADRRDKVRGWYCARC